MRGNPFVDDGANDAAGRMDGVGDAPAGASADLENIVEHSRLSVGRHAHRQLGGGIATPFLEIRRKSPEPPERTPSTAIQTGVPSLTVPGKPKRTREILGEVSDNNRPMRWGGI